MKAINLRTEYLRMPLGIDIQNPRFYWNCQGGITQTAYQIIARRGENIVWDSGKVLSSSMTHILYEGEKLNSRDIIQWEVTLWDEKDAAGEPAESWFEMGFLHPEDWKAKWITGNYHPKKNQRYPADCFQKIFRAEKTLCRARLYITACGLYEAKLNGDKIGDACLTPGCTDYRKRLQYQVYDITSMIRQENFFEVELADGWYRGSIGCFGKTKVYGEQTKLLCQLELYYTDGSRELICSDESFSWSNDGPVRFADLKDGEIVDAGRKASYEGTSFVCKNAVIPTASNNVLPKKKERFSGKLIETPKGDKVLDFGQNIAGFIRFSLKGEKGQTIKLLFGEKLDEAGEFSQKNIHKHHKPVGDYGKMTEMRLMFGQEEKIRGEMQPTPKQELLFQCSGNEDEYEMKFSVFGFRYVKVETDIRIREDDFEAIAVYSNLVETGSFSCSNPLINQLVSNTRWSMKGNFLDIPTDCPTRERLGWLGEGQTFFDTANYFMEAAPFYRKWLKDIGDSQNKKGRPSAVVPYVGFDMLYGSNGSSVGWGDAIVLIPYRYWKRYQDTRILEENYENMKSYTKFMMQNTGQKDKKKARENPFNKYTYEKGVQLGEWLEPEEFRDTQNGSGAKLVLQTEVCTAYLYYVMKCMKEIAHTLGETSDETMFEEYESGAKKAYHWLFLKEGVPQTDRQAKLVRPLALGLVEGNLERELQNQLLSAVRKRNHRIGTGFLSTPFVLQVLTDAGNTGDAYQMLENEELPGWLYEVKQGATTMWEDWEGSEYASLNHYAQGTVCQWLFETAAGIHIMKENHFLIKPIPGGRLTSAGAVWRSIYGEVKSSWKIESGKVIFSVSIPSNTTAQLVLPDGSTYEIAAEEKEIQMEA